MLKYVLHNSERRCADYTFSLGIVCTQASNYADDTTIYTCDKNLRDITLRLEHDCSVALEWLSDNFMKLNADKCHLLVLGQSSDDPVLLELEIPKL